jgi:hypothetical protein
MPRQITFKPLHSPDHYFTGRARVCRILEDAFSNASFGGGRSQAEIIMQAGVGDDGRGGGNNFTAIRHLATGAQVTGPKDGSLLRIAAVLGLTPLLPHFAVMLQSDGDPVMYRNLMRAMDPKFLEKVQMVCDYADSIGSLEADTSVFDEVQRRCDEAEKRRKRQKLLGRVRELLLAERATATRAV